ncbi:MAG: leucine--tRNA ligase, partial [Victivallales bacterium]|nr:leucine--tRNA ligase [Victivallales bacterium]
VNQRESDKGCESEFEPVFELEFFLLNKRCSRNQTCDYSRKKLYVLDMFPYPSGAGLHVGHPEGYTASDIWCRFKRMNGYNVLHTMGWDAFGLPAEQYAVKTGTHPEITTSKNIANFKRQLHAFGFSFDWDREIRTCSPDYYKWTQWIFSKLFEQGLAYESNQPVNWCPALGTVLANEEVINGRSEVGNYPVYRKPIRQWVLKITDYAEKLLEGLDGLDWPEGTLEMQKNWIGRSTGAEVEFPVKGHDGLKLKVYTTRPDTLFGATYMVVAPEHPMLKEIVTEEQKSAVEAYALEASKKSDLDRTELTKEKTGVFTGAYAIDPVNGHEIPVWVSDYVLATYGTGAIMAVPEHDTRDFEFAKKFGLPLVCVLKPSEADCEAAGVKLEDVLACNVCWTGDGLHCNSANDQGLNLNGMDLAESKKTINAWMKEHGVGTPTVNFKLRDWLFSRQRCWGEPFPLVHYPDGHVGLVPEDQLPVELPELENYKPTEDGEPPLARAKEWLKWTDPKTGEVCQRETNTMPQWAGSCWYYLRYIDPHNSERAWDPEKEKYWMPVDLYIGGAEHAVLHLLYARFWHKVLFDLGYVSTPEPFKRLIHQGLILGTSYKDARGVLVPNDEVEARDGKFFHTTTGEELTCLPAKMSKSLKNVVNPDEVIARYGADAFRLYEMFMGPLRDSKPWSTDGVEGVYRFLHRFWKMCIDTETGAVAKEVDDTPMTREQERLLHQTIKKVTEDTENISYNTAISQMMVFLNEFGKLQHRNRAAIETAILLLSPMAPHLCEELWSRYGHAETLAYHPWPKFDEAKLAVDEIEILVQLNGKPKVRLMAPAKASKDELLAFAKAKPEVAALLEGKTLVKKIAVPGRLVSFVVK